MTKFDLTTPCIKCPFRTDVTPYLHANRAHEIATSLQQGATFSCHKTVTYDDNGDHQSAPTEQFCAGALIVSEKDGVSSQATRIAERLGVYDHTKLKMDAPVPDSFRDWVRHIATGGAPAVCDADVEYDYCDVAWSNNCENPAAYGVGGGIMDNPDEPSCDIACTYCGSVMCGACSAADDNDEPVCLGCLDEN